MYSIKMKRKGRVQTSVVKEKHGLEVRSKGTVRTSIVAYSKID